MMFKLLISLFISGILILDFSGCVSIYKLPTPSVNNLFDKSLIKKTIDLHSQNNQTYIPGLHDEVLYYLDMGMLNYYAGNYRLSNEFLSKAEIAIENNFTKSLSQYGASLLLDDRTLSYCGEDYEDIYLNVFKALNFFKLNNIEASGVEFRRVNEKLTLLQDKYNKLSHELNQARESKKVKRSFKTSKVRFHNSALSRYLSAILYSFEKKYDDARIDIQHLYTAFQQQRIMYRFQMPKRILTQYECLIDTQPEICLKPEKSANIHVISFVGRSPEKKIKTYWIITKKNRIIIAQKKSGSGRLDIIPWPGIKSGYHFKFSLPYLKKRKNSVRKIVLFIDDNHYYLEKLEDMASIAVETFNYKKNLIYLKTYIRATIKGLLAAELKKGIEQKKYNKKTKKKKDLSLGDILWIETQKILIDVALEALERADVRSSSFFPAFAYMGEFFVKPGSHHIKIVYYNEKNKPLKETVFGDKSITLNGLNLFQSSFYGIQ
ncbi:hypothetical protein MHK_010712 [Candidatus Magnetomorum sp. HK-1]|nr:hypothetical protein MHK_010712 [Candidatus Magnetomorum sp. HK-1]